MYLQLLCTPKYCSFYRFWTIRTIVHMLRETAGIMYLQLLCTPKYCSFYRFGQFELLCTCCERQHALCTYSCCVLQNIVASIVLNNLNYCAHILRETACIMYLQLLCTQNIVSSIDFGQTIVHMLRETACIMYLYTVVVYSKILYSFYSF